MTVLELAAVASLLKLLLIPTYRSTDFEVHRNWLAITHSLPLKQWYIEDTSEWTLDYPPLFAWFEWILSQAAYYFDSKMLVVSNLNYASDATILFQRLSVIFTDFIYIYAIKEFSEIARLLHSKGKFSDLIFNERTAIIPTLLIFNFGLFIVDHIHFQYNGMLFGIMLLSITRILMGRNVEGAFWFAVLLNMKHIYLYCAPAFFVYLLRCHCFQAKKPVSFSSFSLKNFITLGCTVVFVFLISLGPFIHMGQLGQVLTRLFPFKRGLVHAYWAPNFWALYTAADKVLALLGYKIGLISQDSITQASMTGGMVQEYHHTVLPSVSPLVASLLTFISMIPALVKLWEEKSLVAFVRAIVLSCFSSFLFGWHVHEKAVLMIIIPMTLLILTSREDARIFLFFATTGFYSLFPLLFTHFENGLKVLLLLISTVFTFIKLDLIYNNNTAYPRALQLPLLKDLESLYVLGLKALGFVTSVGFYLLGLDQRLPFLPLLLTSLYCSIGVVYSWIQFYALFYTGKTLSIGFTKNIGSSKGRKNKKIS